MLEWQGEVDGIGVGLVADVETIRTAIDELQTALHVGKPNASMGVFALRHFAVGAKEVEPAGLACIYLDVDEGVALVAHAMLEGILNEGDED